MSDPIVPAPQGEGDGGLAPPPQAPVPNIPQPQAAAATPAIEAPARPPLGEHDDMPAPKFDEGPMVAAGEVAPNLAGPTVIIRHGLMRQIGQFRHDLTRIPPPGTKVVIRTERGVEIGDVVSGISKEPCQRCITQKSLAEFIANNGPEYPFRRDGVVLRVANPQDLIDQRHLETSAREEATYCRQQMIELNLDMRLVTVEHLLGGERIIFFFTAETRVDFRELVRRLAAQFRTRIEMRQVGARDEARIIADYERCGQRCCCQEYLKDLRPVSMRMAKTQKATLDPSKISGRCGRLMCCLRYEDVCYEELRKKLPRKNTWVKTEKIIGKVVDTQIITQLVRLALMDNTQVVVTNEEILERDVPAPPIPPPPPPQPERHHRVRGEGQPLRDTINPPAAPVATPAADAAQAAPQASQNAPAGEPAANEAAPAPLDGEMAPQGEMDSDESTQDAPGGAEEGAPRQQDARQGQGGGRPGEMRQGPGGEGRSGRRRRGRRRGRGGQGGQGQGGPQGGSGQGAPGGQASAPSDGPERAQFSPSDGGAGGDSASDGGDAGEGPRMQGQGGQGGQGGGPGGEGRRRRRRRRGRGGGGGGQGGGGQGGNPGGGAPPPPPSAS